MNVGYILHSVCSVTDIIYLAGQKEIFTLMNVIRLE